MGFCTFKLNEEFRPNLGPWLEDVVVAPKHQKQGIGKMLLDVAAMKAKEPGFKSYIRSSAKKNFREIHLKDMHLHSHLTALLE